MINFKGFEIGLEDKGHVKIKCGDKIKTDKGVGVVIYQPPSFNIMLDIGYTYDNGDFYYGEYSDDHDWDKFEVIGDCDD